MRKVHIDFAPPSLRRAWYRTPRGTWSLLVVALGLAGPLASTVAQYRGLQRAAAERQAQVARTQARAAARVPVAAPAR
ncbi:hypothetical protein ACFQ1A_27715, partial [Massilia pinisoli]